jgi:hypothetical protein
MVRERSMPMSDRIEAGLAECQMLDTRRVSLGDEAG